MWKTVGVVTQWVSQCGLSLLALDGEAWALTPELRTRFWQGSQHRRHPHTLGHTGAENHPLAFVHLPVLQGPRSCPCPSAVLGTGQSSGCCWHTSPQSITSFRAMTTPPSPCLSAAPVHTPGRSCAMGKVARGLGRAGFLLAPGNAMGAGREGTTLPSCLKRAPQRQAPSLTRQGWTGRAGPHPQYGKLICGMRLLVLESGTTPWEEGGGRRRRRKAFLGHGFSSQDHRDILPSYCAPPGATSTPVPASG